MGPITSASIPTTRQQLNTTDPSDTEQRERNKSAKYSIYGMWAIGAGKIGLMSGQAAVKLPESARAGRLKLNILQVITAAPDTRIVDPEAPKIASAASNWKSFTKLDSILYRSHLGVKVSIGVAQLMSAVPNLVDAVQTDGIRGAATTQSGRSGMLQLSGGGLGAALLGLAVMRSVKSGNTTAFQHLNSISTSPLFNRPWVVWTGKITGLTVVANEMNVNSVREKLKLR